LKVFENSSVLRILFGSQREIERERDEEENEKLHVLLLFIIVKPTVRIVHAAHVW
jgi:hypothetical protein